MPSAQEAADALPSNFDVTGLTSALSNPQQALRMLDRNNDGVVTKDDLQLLLQQFGINGMIAKTLAKYMFKELDANKNGTIEASDLTHANGILTRLMKMKRGAGTQQDK
jgi:Ca2+-binding EF-hand superfamily protein